MRELLLSFSHVSTGALDAELRAALPALVLGISASVNARTGRVQWRDERGVDHLGEVTVILDDSATPSDEDTVRSLVAAHDPVWLSADKSEILADGVDAVTVFVLSPLAASPVVLTVGGVDWPIPVANGVGQDTLTSLDPGVYTIRVKAPYRCDSVLTITAR